MRKTSDDEKDQPINLQQRQSFCSFSAFCSFYESQDTVSWAWDESPWPVPVLFRAVAVVEPVFPTAAKGSAWLVAPVPRSRPSDELPTVDSSPPPTGEPGPRDCAHRPPPTSSVRSAQASSAVEYPRAVPACRSDSHARANSATDRSG